MSDTQQRITDLREAIALTKSMIDVWNVNFDHFQIKIAEWEKELEELENDS